MLLPTLVVGEQIVKTLDAPVNDETDHTTDDGNAYPEQEILIQYKHDSPPFGSASRIFVRLRLRMRDFPTNVTNFFPGPLAQRYRARRVVGRADALRIFDSLR